MKTISPVMDLLEIGLSFSEEVKGEEILFPLQYSTIAAQTKPLGACASNILLNVKDRLPDGHLEYLVSDLVDHPDLLRHRNSLRARGERLPTVSPEDDGDGSAVR